MFASFKVNSFRPYPFIDWTDFLYLVVYCIWFLILIYMMIKELRSELYTIIILQMYIIYIITVHSCYFKALHYKTPYIYSIWSVPALSSAIKVTLDLNSNFEHVVTKTNYGGPLGFQLSGVHCIMLMMVIFHQIPDQDSVLGVIDGKCEV